jgi:tRNA(fMet)-specific endonuclease VapC
MPHPKALLDTDTVSFLMQNRPPVMGRAEAYLAEHGLLAMSIITRYEILRGLRVKNATRKMDRFAHLCETSSIVPLTDRTVSIAADIYADLTARGLLIGDADILIAATAMAHGLVVVTNNGSHFQRIQGLTVENWR